MMELIKCSFFDDERIPDELKGKMLVAAMKLQKCHDAATMRSVFQMMIDIIDECEKIDNKESQ